jgi:hypothetical protein
MSLDAYAISVAMRSPGGGRHVGSVESLAENQDSGQYKATGSPIESLAQDLGLPGVIGATGSERSTAAIRSRAISRLLHKVRRHGTAP